MHSWAARCRSAASRMRHPEAPRFYQRGEGSRVLRPYQQPGLPEPQGLAAKDLCIPGPLVVDPPLHGCVIPKPRVFTSGARDLACSAHINSQVFLSRRVWRRRIYAFACSSDVDPLLHGCVIPTPRVFTSGARDLACSAHINSQVFLSRRVWRRRIYAFACSSDAAGKMHRSFAQKTRSG